jgi:hypothetical protein
VLNNIFFAIEKYNKYHSPEAKAKFVKLNKNSAVIEFSGPFCNSCGVSDWFDDFKIELEKKRLVVNIENMKEKDDGYLVKFSFKKS